MNPIDQAIILEEAKRYTNSQRIAYVERQKVVLDTKLTASAEFNGTATGLDSADPNMLEAGKTYTVITDSGTYKTVCKSPSADTKYIGNAAKLGEGEDTGEPFVSVLAYENLDGNGVWFFIFVDSLSGSHVKIVGEETIHPIDQKFIPGAVLPVVELETDIFVNGAICSAEESAALTEAVKKQMPVMVKVTVSEGIASMVMHCQIYNEEKTLFSSILGAHLQLTYFETDGTWRSAFLQ